MKGHPAMTCPICGQDAPYLISPHSPRPPRKVCARPECIVEFNRRRNAEQRRAIIEDVEFLLSHGESQLSIAARLGIQPRSVARRLERAGRPDLARGFYRRTA